MSKLPITEDHLVAELCCGSGELSLALAAVGALRHQIVAVDASVGADLTRQGSGDVRPVPMEPWEFARFPTRYDRILVKDALHGIDAPLQFVTKIRERITPQGSFTVILTVPDPRFEVELLQGLGGRAIPSLDSTEVAAMLEASGYAVRRSHAQLARRMTWAEYLQLVRSRHLPALRCLGDSQLQSLVQVILPLQALEESVEVSHHFDIVSGSHRD